MKCGGFGNLQELLFLGRDSGKWGGNHCSLWVVDSLWHLTLVTNLVKYNTGGEKACHGVCVLQTGITQAVFCQIFYSMKFFINMVRADVDICATSLQVCPCISSHIKSIFTCLRCSLAMLSDFPPRVSSCHVHAALADAFASKAGSDPQEAQGDTGDKRETNADACVVLALNSSFVPLIDCLLLLFSVARMFPEQEAVTLVPLASLSSINCSSPATSVRVGLRLPHTQVGPSSPAPEAADLCRIQVGLILLASGAAEGEY